MDKNNIVERIARIGVFGTFLGHGILALSVNVKWIPLLTCYGFTEPQARYLMPIIGTIDVFVAFMTLLYPIRIVLIWAIFWTFITALSRPISGEEWLEFVERFANFCLPLTLLMLQGFPKNFKSIFKIRD
jgi:hypothetical protein